MKINLKLLLPVIVGLFVLPMFAQSAHAASIDFQCGPLLCGGVMSATFDGSGNALTGTAAGVTVNNDAGPVDDIGLNFTLAFNLTAATPNFSVTEIGGDGSTINGNIVAGTGHSFGGTTVLLLDVFFPTLPSDFAGYLGTSSGAGINENIFIQDNAGQSIDVNIQPVPEPATLLLFGTGLLGLGGLVRRKLNV